MCESELLAEKDDIPQSTDAVSTHDLFTKSMGLTFPLVNLSQYQWSYLLSCIQTIWSALKKKQV